MKPFWRSKTLWLNVIAAIAMFVQNQYGYAISPEIQAYVLVLANAALRVITSEGLSA